MVLKKIAVVYCCVILLFLLTNCQINQVPENFWEGEWTVSTLSFDSSDNDEPIVLGYLTIENEKYEFEPIGSDSDTESLRERLGFLDEVSGPVEVEVQVEDGQSFNNFDDDTVIATVKFGTNTNRETFQIRINQEENKMYFHGGIGEIQLWSIEKDLSGS